MGTRLVVADARAVGHGTLRDPLLGTTSCTEPSVSSGCGWPPRSAPSQGVEALICSAFRFNANVRPFSAAAPPITSPYYWLRSQSRILSEFIAPLL